MAADTTSPRREPGMLGWLQRRAENVAVALIALMFVSFLLQIVFRYVLNRPLGWTEGVTVLCWVWVVLWGASFILSDEEEVRFDIVYNLFGPGVRRGFTVVAGIALVVLLALSLPATWRYVEFMRREHSAYLQMRFDYLYSIYVIFAVVVIIRQLRLVWLAIRGPRGMDSSKPPEPIT